MHLAGSYGLNQYGFIFGLTIQKNPLNAFYWASNIYFKDAVHYTMRGNASIYKTTKAEPLCDPALKYLDSSSLFIL